MQVLDRKDFRAGTDSLDSAIALGLGLVDNLFGWVSPFANTGLGVAELPDLNLTGSLDVAALQAAAPLYLAAELESAGLLPAMERLSALFMSGALPVELGDTATRVVEFWRGRKDRFQALERQAIFARLFGSPFEATVAVRGGRNATFENGMISLADALYQVGGYQDAGQSPGIHQETQLRAVARALAANLSSRSGGMAAFAGSEILTDIRTALEVMKDRRVQLALAARSVWSLVRNIHARYGDTVPEIALHVTRAQSGQTILAWLADVAASLGQAAGSLVSRGHPAIAAAGQWLQATLYLHEQRPTQAG